MCRLFGFRSIIQSHVHRSLVYADNALAVQSRKHADGWGVAYYLAEAPHVIKSVVAARDDQIFERVSGVVSSQTVVAHLRQANVGDVNILNSHPFQYGHWVFAHNGQIPNYAAHRDRLRAEVVPALRRYILGDTDSETVFFIFLTHLSQLADLHQKDISFDLVADALWETIQKVRSIADAEDQEERSKLTFIVTNGHLMVGVRSGVPLLYSTFQSRCRDRGFCPHLGPECEAPTESGFVKHILIASEQLQGDNTWLEIAEDGFIGVDADMRLHQGHFGDGHLKLITSPAA